MTVKFPKTASRREAVDLIAPLVHPELDLKMAKKRIQSTTTDHIKRGNLQAPTKDIWDGAVIFGWVAWMAETSHERKNRVPWARLRGATGLPKPVPPKNRKGEVGRATLHIVANVVPADLEETRQALIEAWARERENKPVIERHQKKVENGKTHGPKGGRPKKD
ncbi:MAG: hypothetical protein WBX11_11435 [Thiobacillaceae bacterium]